MDANARYLNLSKRELHHVDCWCNRCVRYDDTRKWQRGMKTVQFDFSALKHDTPPHLICIAANKECATFCTARKTKFFRIRCMAKDEFSLWEWSPEIDGEEPNKGGHFVLRSDLRRLLMLIGYIKRPPAAVVKVSNGPPMF